MLKDSEGKSHYISLDTTPASSNWSTYTQRFFVPMNVSEILISHPLASIGWLETDNYSLVRTTPDQYNHALVSLTFDDGWESIHQNALPLMKRYGITSTQYLVSGFLGQIKEYMSQNQVYDFENAGHEIASHTVDHPDLTQLTSQAADKELNTSRDNLTKCYAPVTDFAPPFGAVSGNQIMKVKGLYQTSRSTQDGFNSKDTFNPFELKVQNIRSDTSPSQISAWLETAKMNHVWLILVYHQVIENGGEFSRSPRNFESDLQSVIASGITVKTVHGAFTEVSSQVSP
jgi:peptidoglycan/xylan/chitin deacetylase (PgdA/CDA1 family)